MLDIQNFNGGCTYCTLLMGGVLVNPETLSTSVEGLFAAGGRSLHELIIWVEILSEIIILESVQVLRLHIFKKLIIN